jgi:hypothetical protein
MVENIIPNNFILDKYEMYSFTIYLYFYGFLQLYIFEQKILISIFLTFFCNTIFYYLFKNNFITLLCHNYWKHNLNTIALPQLLSCASNIIVFQNFTNKYFITIPIDILFFNFISIIYKNELPQSKNLRFIIAILFFFIRCFF